MSKENGVFKRRRKVEGNKIRKTVTKNWLMEAV